MLQLHDCFELNGYKFIVDRIECFYDTDGLIKISAHSLSVSNVPQKSSNIKKVIFHAPATIVFWKDGSKTVVKCDGELFDREKGLAMAISKKMLGNKGNYFNEFRKWIK